MTVELGTGGNPKAVSVQMKHITGNEGTAIEIGYGIDVMSREVVVLGIRQMGVAGSQVSFRRLLV